MHCRRISWKSPVISRCLSQHPKKKNHYDSLEVDSKATQSEIKSAYFKLTMQYHPDKNASDDAKVKFRNITEAYEVLGNYDKRKQYDRGMQIRTSDENRRHETYKTQDIKKEAYRARTAIYRQGSDTTGTSKMYDFDEWTKAHYGNTFRRSQLHKQDVAAKMSERKFQRDSALNVSTEISVLSLLMCIAILYMAIVTNESYLDRPKTETASGDKGMIKNT